MPKLPKEENRDSCVRKLRICLGTPEQPMPQLKLAQALKVSVETIKSLENKRLRKGIPGETMMENILTEFGAVWVAEDTAWMFVTKVPATRKRSELWRSATFDRVTEIDVLCGGLISLLGQVSDRQFPSASDAVYRALHEIAKATKVGRDPGVGWEPGISWRDRDFMRMDLAIVNVWRKGKPTNNPSDIIGFRRERDHYESFRDLTRSRLNFRSKLPLIKPPSEPIKPSSGQRSKRAAADGSPKTSSPQPQ
jgi:hypothetical protein